MKNNYLLAAFAIFMINFTTVAQDEVIKLWETTPPGSIASNVYREDPQIEDGVVMRIAKVTDPTVSVYRPEKPNGTAIVVFPGGGYSYLSADKEDKKVAQWLIKQGITAFVVKYRLPSDVIMQDKSVGPLQDAQQAVRIVRENAILWGIDGNKIGVIGFSAGGHVASTLCTHYDEKVYEHDDKYSARPDFAVLVYPVISMDDTITHKLSRKNLLGENPTEQKIERFSNELQVTAYTPDTFILHAGDDKSVPVENSLRYYAALRKNNVAAEMHIYEKGGHGFGLGVKGGTSSYWTTDCLNWLKSKGLL